MGYCRVLLCTIGCWRVFGGIECIGGTRGTDRHCGGTTEYWVVLEVLGHNKGVLWGTVECFRVWLGTTGCWGYWMGEY